MTTAQSAAPAAPKQRQKCMEAAYTIPAHAIARSRRPTHGFGAASAFALIGGGCPTIWQPSGRAAAAPPPKRNTQKAAAVVPASPFARRAS